MSARPSFIKRAAQRFMSMRTHLANPVSRAATPFAGLPAPVAPSEPFVVPQTALAHPETPHQADITDPRTIYSKFAAFANGDYVPIARLGEPVVTVKRTPNFRAGQLHHDDANHAKEQIERIAKLVHIVRHNKAA